MRFSLNGILVHAQNILHDTGFVDETCGRLADRRFSEFGGIASPFCPDPRLVDPGIVRCVTSLANREAQLCEFLFGEIMQCDGGFDGGWIVRLLAGAA